MSSLSAEDSEQASGCEPVYGWALVLSPAGFGQWLAHRDGAAAVRILAPPGVPVMEEWDDAQLLTWRLADWPDATSFENNRAPTEIKTLTELSDALTEVPPDALADRSAHTWMIIATEAHADALERLAIVQEHQPGEGVASAVHEIRRVVRRHREQAAACMSPQLLIGGDRSAHDVAQVLVDRPGSVPALIDRNLNEESQLTSFAAALEEIERKYGEQSVRDALAGLLFAKHHSSSWRVTAHVREARRSTRRWGRQLRRVAAEQVARVRDAGDHHDGGGPGDAGAATPQSSEAAISSWR